MEIPKSLCMNCFTVLYDNNTPLQVKKGDAAICEYCGHMMLFDKNLKLVTDNNPDKKSIAASMMVKLQNILLGKNKPGDKLNIVVKK
jgi:DNA-directed RNA polymerase subunit RPC12/RpoP